MWRICSRLGRYPIIEMSISLSGSLQTLSQHLNYRTKILIITRLKPITLIKADIDHGSQEKKKVQKVVGQHDCSAPKSFLKVRII